MQLSSSAGGGGGCCAPVPSKNKQEIKSKQIKHGILHNVIVDSFDDEVSFRSSIHEANSETKLEEVPQFWT